MPIFFLNFWFVKIWCFSELWYFSNFWPKMTQFKSKFSTKLSRGQNNWYILKSKLFKLNFRFDWHVYLKFSTKLLFLSIFDLKISFLKIEILWNITLISWWVSMMSSDWSIMNYVALVWLLTLFGLTIIPKHEIAKVSLVSGSEKIEITKKKNDSRINENNDFKLNKFRLYIISI